MWTIQKISEQFFFDKKYWKYQKFHWKLTMLTHINVQIIFCVKITIVLPNIFINFFVGKIRSLSTLGQIQTIFYCLKLFTLSRKFFKNVFFSLHNLRWRKSFPLVGCLEQSLENPLVSSLKILLIRIIWLAFYFFLL